MHSYAIGTYVLQERHIPILQDWLDFLHQKPDALAVHIGSDPAIRPALEAFCADAGVALHIIGNVAIPDVRRGEARLLSEQFAAVDTEFMVILRLDTFVYRDGHETWLASAFDHLKDNQFCFFTAAQNRFRGDRPVTDTPFLTTRHVSNNLAIYRRDMWRHMQDTARDENLFDPARKLFAEKAVILYCFDREVHGIRRLSDATWRVLHTNAWDERMFTVREDARQGVGLDRYLAQFEEDKWHPWERFYGHPRPRLHEWVPFWLSELRKRIGRGGPRRFPMPLE